MSDFAVVWRFARSQLDNALDGLSDAQMLWRLYPEAHNIGEIVYHIAGYEHYWTARLTGADPAATEYEALLDLAVLNGFLREGVGGPFRDPKYLSASAGLEALEFTRARLEPLISRPGKEHLERQIQSPLGDTISGREGLARLAQHAAYHTGQIWQIAQSPAFPIQ